MTPTDARSPLVTNSETINSVVSIRASRPHSARTSLACNLAHGAALDSAPSSRYDRRGQRADVDTDGPSPSRKAEPTPEPSSSGTADRGPPAVPPAVLALPLIGRKAMGLRPPPR